MLQIQIGDRMLAIGCELSIPQRGVDTSLGRKGCNLLESCDPPELPVRELYWSAGNRRWRLTQSIQFCCYS